jgi:hypothetical protein
MIVKIEAGEWTFERYHSRHLQSISLFRTALVTCIYPYSAPHLSLAPMPTGTLIAIPDKREVCLVARCVETFTPGEEAAVWLLKDAANRNSMASQITTYNGSKTAVFVPVSEQVFDESVNNLISLDVINEMSVLHKLRLRFKKNQVVPFV